MARRYQLVISHARDRNLTRQTIASIQQGIDPNDPTDDTLVLCYVSVGEDLRTGNVSDAALTTDPRFRGDGIQHDVVSRPRIGAAARERLERRVVLAHRLDVQIETLPRTERAQRRFVGGPLGHDDRAIA